MPPFVLCARDIPPEDVGASLPRLGVIPLSLRKLDGNRVYFSTSSRLKAEGRKRAWKSTDWEDLRKPSIEEESRHDMH